MRETKRFHLEHFRPVAEPEVENDQEDQRQPHPTFGDGANSIFLVEIVDADEVVEDGMERLNVEYTNTIAYRVPVDEFVKYHGIRRENQINEEDEFSVLIAYSLFVNKQYMYLKERWHYNCKVNDIKLYISGKNPKINSILYPGNCHFLFRKYQRGSWNCTK